ncbi:MAG: YcbK family protein [Smithellaceae bacterium]
MVFNPIIKKYLGIIAVILMLSAALSSHAWAREESPDMRRYFFSGDGNIALHSERTNRSFSGFYRRGLGDYDDKALYQICEVYGASCESSRMELSLRLIEFIDYLEDHLNRGAKITITSGYRKPAYNKMIRERGNLAAKASLHQYGMAADLKIKGVKAKTLWNYIKDIKFGGAGYYHGDVVHIDVGPVRSWDETTSGVGTKISDDNKLIRIITDYDVYQPGMTVTLRFIRMTAFPIRVSSTFSLIRQKDQYESDKLRDFMPVFSNISQTDQCMAFRNIDEMNNIKWELPKDLKPGRYQVQVQFCDDAWPDMPRQIQTPEFECRKDGQ